MCFSFAFRSLISTFAGMNQFKENVILADADYVDHVAFDLIVNFERMIGRQIPKADMARWVDCVALDGGLRQGDNEVQVVLIHDKGQEWMKNFAPADYERELNGQAFKDHLGEFVFETHPVEDLVSKADFMADALQMLCSEPTVKRLMVIPNCEDDATYRKMMEVLHRIDDNDKRITLFAMQPLIGCPCRQEILGYSLMAALGIRGEEVNSK